MSSTVVARWCLSAKFGRRASAVNLCKDWVKTFGPRAGLQQEDVSIQVGYIGPAISQIELNAKFDSVSEFEVFMLHFSDKEIRRKHAHWANEMHPNVVDASMKWELWRSVSN